MSYCSNDFEIIRKDVAHLKNKNHFYCPDTVHFPSDSACS